LAKPAKDLRDAAQEKWPGATVSKRGRSFIEHQHPDNPQRKMLDTVIGAIHYGVNEDQEIDTAWLPSTGAWQLEMTHADFHGHARDVFNVGDLIQFTKDDEWVIFDPQSINWINQDNSRQQIAIKQAVSAVVDDDKLYFNQGYGAGRHFRYHAQPTRLAKLITIDAPEYLPTPTVEGTIHFEAEFTLKNSAGIELWLDGVKWTRANNVRVRTANRIEFRRETDGAVLWVLDFPRAFDSGDGEVVGEMEVQRLGGNYFCRVRIPKTWIDAAQFPIYIDPTVDVQVGESSDDAHQNLNNAIDLTSVSIWHGYDDVNNRARYVGFRWDGVNIPNSSVIDVAYVEPYFQAADEDLDTTVDFQDNDNPSTFVATNNNISDRNLTNNGVAWATKTTLGFMQTPSLINAVQAVVDRVGWTAENAMVCIFSATYDESGIYARVRSWDYNVDNAPKLHIEYTESGTPQYARPNADISLGGWTDQDDGTTNIYQSIDEVTPSDLDYIKSSVNPTSDVVVIGLESKPAPIVDTGHVLRYRYRKEGSGTVNINVALMEGSSVIASWQHDDIGAITTAEQTLTELQAGSITDYSNLRFRVTASEP
jgi:hypothetical protein